MLRRDQLVSYYDKKSGIAHIPIPNTRETLCRQKVDEPDRGLLWRTPPDCPECISIARLFSPVVQAGARCRPRC